MKTGASARASPEGNACFKNALTMTIDYPDMINVPWEATTAPREAPVKRKKEPTNAAARALKESLSRSTATIHSLQHDMDMFGGKIDARIRVGFF